MLTIGLEGTHDRVIIIIYTRIAKHFFHDLTDNLFLIVIGFFTTFGQKFLQIFLLSDITD